MITATSAQCYRFPEHKTPEDVIRPLNDKIGQLHPKRELMQAIAVTTLATVGIVGTAGMVYFGFSPLLLCAIPVCALTMDLQIRRYSKFYAQYLEVIDEINRLKKFDFKESIFFTVDNSKSITKYFRAQNQVTEYGIALQAIRTQSCWVNGSTPNIWSINQRTLTYGQAIVNTEEVLARYQPWIDLLREVSETKFQHKYALQKNYIGSVIAAMIHPLKQMEDTLSVDIMHIANIRNKMPFFYCGKHPHTQEFCIVRVDGAKTTYYTTAQEFKELLKQEYFVSDEMEAID